MYKLKRTAEIGIHSGWSSNTADIHVLPTDVTTQNTQCSDVRKKTKKPSDVQIVSGENKENQQSSCKTSRHNIVREREPSTKLTNYPGPVCGNEHRNEQPTVRTPRQQVQNKTEENKRKRVNKTKAGLHSPSLLYEARCKILIGENVHTHFSK